MLDSTTFRILGRLQENARTSNVDIARDVGMVPSAVLARIRNLERDRVILKYETRVDARSLGLALTAFILVRSEEPVGAYESGRKLADLPEIQEVHYLAGEFHYWLKVRVPDTDGLARLLKKIGAVPGIRDTRTTLVLSTIKESLALPLPQESQVRAGAKRRHRKRG